MSNTRLDRAGVKAKFDVFPEQIVDYLALVGDSSDNIPGITGVGPKTAAKWLNQYGTLDSLIAHAADIARQGRRESARRAAGARTVAQARDHRHGVEARGDRGGSHRRRAGSGAACGSCTGGSNCGRCEVAGVRAGAAAPVPARGRRSAGTRGVRLRASAVRRGGGDGRRCSARSSRGTRLSQDRLARPGRWLAKLAAAPLISFDTETDSLDYMQAGSSACLSL